MVVYGDINSGNCYKIKLVLSLLQIEHQWQHVDILNGESHTPEFLLKNPTGKIPLLELDDGRCLSESNAIINYLASNSRLLPNNTFDQAKVLQWQFFEQYSHEPYIAVARFIAKYLGLPEERKAEYLTKQAGGYKALAVMEQQLTTSLFLVGNEITVADISLYAYTHVANEGGFDLNDYPAILTWLSRITKEAYYVDMLDCSA